MLSERIVKMQFGLNSFSTKILAMNMAMYKAAVDAFKERDSLVRP